MWGKLFGKKFSPHPFQKLPNKNIKSELQRHGRTVDARGNLAFAAASG